MNNARRLLFIGTIALLALAIFQLNRFANRLIERNEQQTAKPFPLITTNNAAALDQVSENALDKPLATGSDEERKLMQDILVRYNVGDYGAALVMTETALAQKVLTAAMQQWLSHQLPVLLVSNGWLKIKSGECNEAIDYLRRAESLGKQPLASKGLGFCFHKLKQPFIASQYFSDYLQQEPKDIEALMFYADSLESEQRFEEAVAALEAAEEQNPQDEELKKRLHSMRAKADESPKQSTIETQNFRLSYRDEDHSDLAEYALNQLESALAEFSGSFGFREPPQPIEVVLYASANFKNFVQGSPDWAVAIFDGRLRIPIHEGYRSPAGLKALDRVLRHELVHALLALMSDFREIPSWLNEGLAQRLECSDLCSHDLFPPTPGDFLSINELSQSYRSYDVVKAEKSYRQSLYLVLAATRRFGMDESEALGKVIGSINGKSPLSNNALLEPLKLNFQSLHSYAIRSWNKRDKLN